MCKSQGSIPSKGCSWKTREISIDGLGFKFGISTDKICHNFAELSGVKIYFLEVPKVTSKNFSFFSEKFI